MSPGPERTEKTTEHRVGGPTSAHGPGTGRKKPPACDYCKARRVLCHPQPDGKSCPRCVEKGVKCTTTPVVRRKRNVTQDNNGDTDKNAHDGQGQDHDAEIGGETSSPAGRAWSDDGRPSSSHNAQNGGIATLNQAPTSSSTPTLIATRISADSPSASVLAPSANSTGVRSTHPGSVDTTVNPVPRIQVPTTLVAELFNSFIHIPYSHHPIFPYERIRTNLAGLGWQPALLPPQERVLVYCILAVTSLASIDPFIIGPEPLPPECNAQILTTPNPVKNIRADLRDLGKRRETICQQLRVEALRQAKLEGIAVCVSQENAASCYLLDALENRNDSSTAYAAVFAWQARTLAESWCRHIQPSTNLFGSYETTVRWRGFLMSDAVCALSADRSISFTQLDERLICGQDGPSLQKLLEQIKNNTCNWMQFYTYLPSLMFQITRLARQSQEYVTGVYARRQPLNRPVLTEHLADLGLLQEICESYTALANMLGQNLQPKQLWVMQSCTSAVTLGWTNLILSLFRSLNSRLEESIISSHSRFDLRPDVSQSNGSDRAPLEEAFGTVKTIAAKAALEYADQVENLSSLARLTHMKVIGGNLRRWAHFLLDVADATIMSPVERARALQQVRDGIKLAGFSLVDYTDLVEIIDSQLQVLSSANASDPAPMSIPSGYHASVVGISPYDSLFSEYGPFPWNMNWMDMDSMQAPQYQGPVSGQMSVI